MGWSFATVETFGQDVRHTLRLMRRAPEFAFTAVATLPYGKHGMMYIQYIRSCARRIRPGEGGEESVAAVDDQPPAREPQGATTV